MRAGRQKRGQASEPQPTDGQAGEPQPPDAKVPSTQSAVQRRRRPLKLTQPSERGREASVRPDRASDPGGCGGGSGSGGGGSGGGDAPPANPIDDPGGEGRDDSRGGAAPRRPSRLQAAALPAPRPLAPPPTPREARSSGAELHVRLSQDAERVYWDPASAPSAEIAKRASDLQAARETAVVRSSVRRWHPLRAGTARLLGYTEAHPSRFLPRPDPRQRQPSSLALHMRAGKCVHVVNASPPHPSRLCRFRFL